MRQTKSTRADPIISWEEFSVNNPILSDIERVVIETEGKVELMRGSDRGLW